MSEFVYFTPQEKEAARNADIAEMLERQGERLKRSGSEYEWGEGDTRQSLVSPIRAERRQRRVVRAEIYG